MNVRRKADALCGMRNHCRVKFLQNEHGESLCRSRIAMIRTPGFIDLPIRIACPSGVDKGHS